MTTQLAHIHPDPFGVRGVTHAWQPGETLTDILGSAGVCVNQRDDIIICMNGDVVNAEYWHVVHPKPDTLITVNVLPKGGGNGALRTIAFIAVAVLAAYTGGIAGGIWAAGPSISTGASAAISGLAAAAVYTVGSLAVNALLPISSEFENGDVRSESLSIAPSRNRFAPFGVPPLMLGRMRVFPNFAAASFTELRGDDEYVTMLFHLSYKNIWVYRDTAQFGDTLLTNYNDIVVQYDVGSGSFDEPITLYTNNQTQTPVNQIIPELPDTVVIGAASNSTSVVLDIQWLAGLIRYDFNDAGTDPATSDLTFGWRVIGDTVWNEVIIQPITAESSDVKRDSFIVDLPNDGQSYEIGAWSNTPVSGPPGRGVYNEATWTVLHSKQSGVPVLNDRAALCAIDVRATKQLNGIPDIFNVEIETGCWRWNSTNQRWDYGTSNNPAALARFILTTPGINARALPVERLNLPSFQLFSEFCDTQGFTFNMYVDFSVTCDRLLQMICAAGRAMCYPIDGIWTVVIDQPQTQLANIYTPRNTRGKMSVVRSYPDIAHAFRVRFISEVEQYKNSERVVYRNGYSEFGDDTTEAATKFEAIEFPGVTNPDHIWKLARYRLSSAVLQPEMFTIPSDVEHLTVLPGNLIAYQNESILIGYGSARITFVDIVENSYTVDTPLEFDIIKPHGFHGFRVRHKDGTSETFRLRTPISSPAVTFELFDPWVWSEADELVVFGEFGQLSQVLLVKNLLPEPDMNASISCVPYNDKVYDVDNETPSEYFPIINQPIIRAAPMITVIRSDGAVMGTAPNGDLITTMSVSFSPTAGDLNGYSITRVEYRVMILGPNNTPWRQAPYSIASPAGTSRITDVIVGKTYDVRVQGYFLQDGGIQFVTPWDYDTHTVVGDLDVPPDVETFTFQFDDQFPGVLDLRHWFWAFASDAIYSTPIVGYEIRYKDYDTIQKLPNPVQTEDGQDIQHEDFAELAGTIDYEFVINVNPDWDNNMTPVNPDSLIPVSPYSSYIPSEQRDWVFAIKAKNASGNWSINPAYVYATTIPGAIPPEPPAGNVLIDSTTSDTLIDTTTSAELIET